MGVKIKQATLEDQDWTNPVERLEEELGARWRKGVLRVR